MYNQERLREAANRCGDVHVFHIVDELLSERERSAGEEDFGTALCFDRVEVVGDVKLDVGWGGRRSQGYDDPDRIERGS